MAAIGSISSASAALLSQIQGTGAAQQQQSQKAAAPPQDTVQLSKAALSAFGSGAADHVGDSH